MGEYWEAGKKLADSDLKGFSCILVFIIDAQGLYSPSHLQIRVAIESSEVLSSSQSRRSRVSDVGSCRCVDFQAAASRRDPKSLHTRLRSFSH